jgi:alkylation response protein AidB-like acyl-CoA dehydrogenase
MPLDFSLDPEQQAFAARAREAFAPLRGWYRERRHGEVFEESWRALAAGEFFATVAALGEGQAHGGALRLCLALEELGAVGLPSMLPILTAAGSVAVARHGGEALRRRLLPGIAAGEGRLCLAITEAEAGFNTFRIRTRAERRSGGYSLHGAKIYVSAADLAGAMLVLARSIPFEECEARGLPKTAGLCWLVVDPRSPGLELRPIPTRGEGSLRQFEVDFESVEVPAEALVGGEAEGFPVLLDLVNLERVLVAALLAGAARHCLEIAVGHARTRRVFDEPIGRYQSIQHPLAEVSVRLEAVRLLTWRAAATFDAGAPPKVINQHGNAAKLLAAELAAKALDAAFRTLGGKGFDERCGVVHLLELVALMQVAPISEALILNQLAEGVLGLPRSY